jgi:nucleoside-diphosphate-sugar epimerase
MLCPSKKETYKMKALVTGGGGFLGCYIVEKRYIVEKLVHRGDSVRVFSRSRYEELEALGAETVQGDIRSYVAVNEACKDIDTVFHTAALAGVWGRKKDFFDINVTGTENVIRACIENGVRKLVYTSSPSAIFGRDDIKGANEAGCPYPKEYLCEYARTKAIAERKVLAANGKDGLLTVALRPHIIWGPRDNHLIPRIIDRAKKRKLKKVGDMANLVDIVYVENAADAHLNAADVLSEGSPAAGRAYFISQGEPVNLWDWIDNLLELVGAPKIEKRVPFKAAYFAGTVMEAVYRIFCIKKEPLMTRFIAAQLAKSHYFDITAAKRELGYSPAVSTEEGLKRLVEHLKGSTSNGEKK